MLLASGPDGLLNQENFDLVSWSTGHPPPSVVDAGLAGAAVVLIAVSGTDGEDGLLNQENFDLVSWSTGHPPPSVVATGLLTGILVFVNLV